MTLGATIAVDANASCGDYLHVGKHSQASPHGNVTTQTDSTLPLSQARFPVPCNGPNCRRQMPTSPLPQPSPISVRPDQSALRFVYCELPTSNLIQQLDLLDAIAVDGYPTRLKRPPRA